MIQPVLLMIVGIAILNGIFSPYTLAVFLFNPAWYPAFLPASPSIVLFLSSLLISTLTLMVAGVPAALYERFAKLEEATYASMGIWLVGTLVLSLPAVARAAATFAG